MHSFFKERYFPHLLALTLVGFCIRIYNLGFQTVNGDELFTIAFSSTAMSFYEVFVNALSRDFTPPLFYLCAHASMLISGETAFAIRLPSVLFGTILIPVSYYIGKEYRDDLMGLLLAGVTALFYSFIYYSKYGRAYSMALLFFGLAFLYFMRTLNGNKKDGVWFGIFALLSLWTHLFTVIPLGVMIIYLLWKHKAFSGIAVLILGALPLLNYILIVTTTRVAGTGENIFGADWNQILVNTPLDVFAYSTLIILPVILYTLWKHRTELLVKLVAGMSVVTWLFLFVIAPYTPVVPHYAIFVITPLLLLFLIPFHAELKKSDWNTISFPLVITAATVLLIELIQTYWVLTIQRITGL